MQCASGRYKVFQFLVALPVLEPPVMGRPVGISPCYTHLAIVPQDPLPGGREIRVVIQPGILEVVIEHLFDIVIDLDPLFVVQLLSGGLYQGDGLLVVGPAGTIGIRIHMW